MRISDWSSDVCSSDLTLHPDVELDDMVARLLLRVWNLAFGACFEIAQKGRAHRARIETGRRETVEQHIAVVERAQTVLPLLRDRAFLGQQQIGRASWRERVCQYV